MVVSHIISSRRDFSDLLPDVKNQIHSNKAMVFISAKIREIVMPKTVSNNVVPEFISSMNTASNLLDNVKTKPARY